MAKKFYIVLGAIPVIVALLISTPLLLRTEIPTTAANPLDFIEIEYTKHQLKTISYGVTERTGAQKTEILYIKNDGDTKYSVTEESYLRPDVRYVLDAPTLNRIKALIKETGFIAIPSESFPVMQNITEYQKSNVKVTLNGQVNQIHWPEQNATARFIPPIITAVELALDNIISDISK
ncbi:MAG: hypothetical protein EB829_03815 [Nitrosopumilus sp. H8]|nr:MAG: hypothetical protein EB830_06815 [Nitrosopumilus sp. H13]RNJ78804.1 MAG: hypothetical protein EB829_03815 [Nitrosopumilus sp. H8]